MDIMSGTPDVIILFMGTNDFYVRTPIGTEGDGMGTTPGDTLEYLEPVNTIVYDGDLDARIEEVAKKISKADSAEDKEKYEQERRQILDEAVPITENTLQTFYGGVEHCMARIKQLWPCSRVCVLTPLQRLGQVATCTDSETGETRSCTLEEYRDVIIKTADKFSYPIKDLFTEANFAPCNTQDRCKKTLWVESSQTYDGLHPSESFGRDNLAPLIGQFIEGI